MVTMTTVAERMIEALRLVNIATLFCLPGKQNDDFFDALVDAPDIRPIHTRHEQGAAYMALGAAQATGLPSAFCIVPGPGLLNAGAALTSGYWGNARMLAVVGQIPTGEMGRGWGVLHEMPDQRAVLDQVTKHTESITDPEQATAQIQRALDELVSGRPRPVAIEISADLWSQPCPGTLKSPQRLVRLVDADALERAASVLAEAKRPLIVVGGGAQDASVAVSLLAHELNAPVTTRRMGHGVVPTDDPWFVPLPVGRDFWADADVVLALGTRLEFPLLHWGHDDDLTLIKVDIDEDELDRHGATTIGLLGDTGPICSSLFNRLRETHTSSEIHASELDERRRLFTESIAHLQPQLDYLAALRSALPDDGVLVEDVTQIGFGAHLAFDFGGPRTFISSGPAGTLGAGFATGLGATVALGERAVVTVTGDGGFLFTATELATAVQHGIAAVTVVFNDGAYGNVRRIQRNAYGPDRVIASELHNPDFVAFAESFGAVGLRAESPDGLASAVRQGLSWGEPVVIDVPVGEMPDPWPFLRMGRVRGQDRPDG